MDFLQQQVNLPVKKRSFIQPNYNHNFKLTPQIKQRFTKKIRQSRQLSQHLRGSENKDKISNFDSQQLHIKTPSIYSSQKFLATQNIVDRSSLKTPESSTAFMKKYNELNQQQFMDKLFTIDQNSQHYSLVDVQKRIIKCFSQKTLKVPGASGNKRSISTANPFTESKYSSKLQQHNQLKESISDQYQNQSQLFSDLVVKILGRDQIGASIISQQKKQDQPLFPQKELTLQEERDRDQYEEYKKMRAKLPKIDLKKISVPEALKLLQDKKADLFQEKSKSFSQELERMILSIDENQLIQYIRDEISKKDNVIDSQRITGIPLNNELLNQEIWELQNHNKRILFNLAKDNSLEQVPKVTENEIFDERLTKAIKERRKILKDPEQRAKQVFFDNELLKENQAQISENQLTLKLKKRFKNKIYECAKQLQDMRMDMKQFITDNVMPTKPYERPGSEKFINAAKSGDEQTIEKMLKQNRYYVYDFDNLQQTALHWAAKRNYPKVCEILVENGAIVNAMDISGRTPLFQATNANNFECIKALLAANAIPLYKTHSNKSAFDVAKTSVIERYLTKAQLLAICLKLIPARRRQQVWEQEGLYYFKAQGDKLND